MQRASLRGCNARSGPKSGRKGGKMLFGKLLGRMAEKGLKKGTVAKMLGITDRSLSNKLYGRNDWKLTEVYRLIEMLDISYEDIYDYFFAPLNFG